MRRTEAGIVVLSACAAAVVVAFVGIFVVMPWWDVHDREQVIARLSALTRRIQNDAADRVALDEIMSVATSNSSWARTQGIIDLGVVGPHAAPATDLLIAALRGPDPFNNREAAIAIGKLGPSAASAVPALVWAVGRYPDADTGWFAAESLGSVARPDDANARRVLEQATRTGRYSLPDSARRGLARLDARAAAERAPATMRTASIGLFRYQ